jgi:alpha-glucosidase (family GH31 glycosyl hydrolase)
MKRSIACVCGMMLAGLNLQAAEQAAPARQTDVSLASVPKLVWKQRAPGVWMTTIGKPEPGPMAFAAPPRLDALAKLGRQAFPAALAEARGDVRGMYASVRIPLGQEENLYGLGMRDDGQVGLRSRSYELKVTPSTHAPVPFYLSSAGYGVMFNTARVLRIQMGIGNRKDSPWLPPEVDRNTDRKWSSRYPSDAVEANVTGAGMEVYLFAGKDLLEVVQRYNLYAGGGCLPSRWGLGFWHRIHTRRSADEILEEVDEFTLRDMPLDVVGLEPGWQSASYPSTYDWDPTRFPDPAGFVKALTARGLSTNLWINPFISKRSSLYRQLLPYTGSHMYWLGAVPDYTLAPARDIFLAHQRKTQLALGISGYKLDEVDEITPEHALFPSGLSGDQMRQIHGMAMQKMQMEAFRAMNRRTYGLVRGSNAGASSYPFAIYSDGYNHHGFVQMVATASLSGVLWCPEVRSGSSDEDWVRRFATIVFAPVMQLNGWSSGLKPWSKPAAEDAVRSLMKLRTRFVPYFYTAFAEYQRTGIPPVRHMILEGPQPHAEAKRIEVADQFLFGPSILVAPMFAGESSRKVALPPGKWFDFYTGKLAGEGATITVSAPLDQVPLFVRDGGIVPLMAAVNSVRREQGAIPLEVRHYGTREASYQLYDDDGETFDYEKGAFSLQPLRVAREAGTLKGYAGPPVGNWKSRYTAITWKFMTN